MSIISIIIPVYNTSKYLRTCLDSLMQQTFQDWEVILVNDGSSDDSGLICDEYCNKDDRFFVVHKKNGGVSSARNVGIEQSRGEYVTFLDSDDYYSNDTLESIIKPMLLNEDVDLVDFPYLANSGKKNEEIKVSVNRDKLYVGKKEIIKYWFYNPRFESCSRLYRLKLIGDLRFCENLHVGEDTAFFLTYLLRCKNIFATKDGLYFYCFRQNSTMNSLSKSDVINSDMLMLEFISENNVGKTDLFIALIYRVLMSKVTNDKFSSYDMKCYKYYLNSLRVFNIIKSCLPIKAKINLLLIKLFGFKHLFIVRNIV